MSNTGFAFRGVSRAFGGTAALSDVSFTLQPEAHVALLGRSGCGKSTVLRLLCGLDAPTAGEVSLNGDVVSTAGKIIVPPHRRGIALVFQDLALWPNLTALDNVLLGLAGSALPRLAARQRAQEALTMCGIPALARRKPAQLSGGEQQRVALARALAVRPNFLLLDEPFAGLDLVTKEQLLAEVSGLAAAHRIGVVFVSHDPLEVLTLCQSAIVLDAGRVVEAGPLAELLAAPRSGLLRSFRQHLSGLPGGGAFDKAAT